MGKTPVQEERSEKAPVITVNEDSIRFERTDPMQDFRVIQIADRSFE
jgi:hypothetical protein